MTYRPMILASLACLLAAGCNAASPTTQEAASPAGPAVLLRTETRQETWTGYKPNGLQIVSTNYTLYTTTKQQYFLENMPAFLEATYRNYLALSGLPARPGSKRMPVYLMASRPEWVELTKRRMGESAEPYMRIQSGGYMFEGACVFWNIGPMRTFRVASHEGFHQFFHHRLRHRPPVWLEEGMCTLAEGLRIEKDLVLFDPGNNPDRFSSMRAGLDGPTWIPLKQLLVMDAGEAIAGTSTSAVQYYGQLWALCLYLRSQEPYRTGLARLLADAEAGQLHKAAGMPRQALDGQHTRPLNRAISLPIFRHYFSDDLDSFERGYIAFARKLAKFR